MTDTAQKEQTQQASLVAELFSHAISKSSAALSKLLNKEVKVTASESFFASLRRIPDYFGPSEDIYTAVAMKLTKDAQGVLLFLIQEEDANELASYLVANTSVSGGCELLEARLSALKEVANIIFGALLTEISEVSSVQLLSSIPDLTTDMIKASLDELCGEIALHASKALAFTTAFVIEPLDVQGKLVLIIDDTSVREIIHKVK